MKYLNDLKSKLSSAAELLFFLWSQKLWWLIPMVVVLVTFGLLLIVAQGTAILHFVYPLF